VSIGPKLGLGMSQFEKSTGMSPCTSTPDVVRSASMVKVTGLVFPRRVRFPVACAEVTAPTAGISSRVMGWVRVKVAVG
jgi:hypothetical protein